MTWKEELKAARCTAPWLLEHVGLTPDIIKIDENPAFKVFVPPRWLARIEKNNPLDPLLLQVLSQSSELIDRPRDSKDPLDEAGHTVVDGMLHKYPNRILVITSGACPIHCRYCFRRHFPYEQHALTEVAWQGILSYIKGREDIFEVILSGGDPLMLSDVRLEKIFSDLASLPSIRRIRIHTRFATTIPSRFTDDFWEMLAPFSHLLIWVWHINHADELGEDVRAIVSRAMAGGMRVLSQSVLLKGVNDNLETLRSLMWALDDSGIQPYYMHQMDRVSGASHYEVPLVEGLALMDALQQSMPGYLVPRYVQEIPGKRSKTPLSKDFIDILA